MYPLAKILILAGAFLLIAGLLVVLIPRIPLLGRLPGDIMVERRGVTIIIPLTSAILLSAVVTLILNLCLRK